MKTERSRSAPVFVNEVVRLIMRRHRLKRRHQAEPSFMQTMRRQPHALCIHPQRLDPVRAPVAEYEPLSELRPNASRAWISNRSAPQRKPTGAPTTQYMSLFDPAEPHTLSISIASPLWNREAYGNGSMVQRKGGFSGRLRRKVASPDAYSKLPDVRQPQAPAKEPKGACVSANSGVSVNHTDR